MEHQGKLNFNLKKFIRMGIFLIGVGILVWQCKSTVVTFFSFRTTVAISKETSESLPPPTIVLCQENKWDNGFRFPWLEHQLVNVSDKYWLFNQFYRLKDKMNISMFDVELMIGNNSFSLPKGIKKVSVFDLQVQVCFWVLIWFDIPSRTSCIC